MTKKNSNPIVSTFGLFKTTIKEFIEDRAPMLGASLAYYTVFSLAPLVLVLLAVIGWIFRENSQAAWLQITEQMGVFLDSSAVKVIQDIADQTSDKDQNLWATIIGIALALFGASGVFGQLQVALNTIWGVKPKPGGGIARYIQKRFLSFAMVAGVIFMLLVTLVVTSLLRAFSGYLQEAVPGGAALTGGLFFIFDFAVMVLLFGIIFKILPDAVIRWRDVWIGAALTAAFFLVGKWALGLYLGSGTAASAYGTASSLITLLLWIYYSAQILLFGGEFTQVYANRFGTDVIPAEDAVRVERPEIEEGEPGDPNAGRKVKKTSDHHPQPAYARTSDSGDRAVALSSLTGIHADAKETTLMTPFSPTNSRDKHPMTQKIAESYPKNLIAAFAIGLASSVGFQIYRAKKKHGKNHAPDAASEYNRVSPGADKLPPPRRRFAGNMKKLAADLNLDSTIRNAARNIDLNTCINVAERLLSRRRKAI